MKKLIFIILSLLIIISCKKDVVPEIIEEDLQGDTTFYTPLMDTISPNETVNLRIFGNDTNFIKFWSSESIGGSTGRS